MASTRPALGSRSSDTARPGSSAVDRGRTSKENPMERREVDHYDANSAIGLVGQVFRKLAQNGCVPIISRSPKALRPRARH